MYEPVGRLDRVLVDHDVDMRGATVVETRVNGSHFRDTICISVPATAEPGLFAVESTGAAGFEGKGGVPAVHTGRIGW